MGKLPENIEVSVGLLESFAYTDGSNEERDAIHDINDELHRLTAIAEGVDPLVVRLGDVTTRLEAADGLLRFVSRYLDPRHYTEVIRRIDAHLQGAGDEA